MPKHIQQTHLYNDGFDINSSTEEVSTKTLTNADRDVKVSVNADNIEFQVTNAVDIEITSSGDIDFKAANQGLSFQNGETLTGESLVNINGLASNVTKTGTRYDFSKEVFVNKSNIEEFNSMASGTPLTLNYHYVASDGATARTTTFSNQALQFSSLEGGSLILAVNIQASSTSGFVPELSSLVLDYGSGNTLTIPLNGVGGDAGQISFTTTIPNLDYSAFLNTNCDITLNANFRGNSFIGSIQILDLVNTLEGTLREGVKSIADSSAMAVEQRLEDLINNLALEIDNDGTALNSISDRISPYKNIDVRTPYINTLYLDSTGVDSFPSDLSTMNQVNPGNPRFTSTSTTLFIGVEGGIHNYIFKNVSKSTEIPLDDVQATVELGESRVFNNSTYFVYRITGLDSGDNYEIDILTSSQVVAWQNDIDNLESDIERIDAELSHAALNLPDALVDVLDNEVTVTEETNPSTKPSDYNNSLGSAGTQTIFYEGNPQTASGGFIRSEAINANIANDRYRNKFVYIPSTASYTNQDILTSFDGTTSTPLISYLNGTFNAKVFVPAVTASTTNVTVYPAQSSKVSGQGIWQTVDALTFVNGIPTAEADEIFFTRNIPSSATTLTIQYRGHANGNVFGSNTTTLANVGGGQEVSTSFTLNDGSETVIVEVRYYPSNRTIRVSETTRVNTGLPTINDIQVILSFQESRTIPATPATTRDVPLEYLGTSNQVFAIKPSDDGRLILVGDQVEINTGYAYTTLFGASEAGHLSCAIDTATFLDYEDIDVISSTITDLENHSTLPQFGLFTTEYTHNTIVNFDTRLTAKNSQGDTVNLGEELILVAPNNNRYRLGIDNTGVLTIVLVT